MSTATGQGKTGPADTVQPKQVLIVGAGPGGLAAAEILALAGHAVTVVDRMPSVGRKFLMAGRSGLNLTNAEPTDAFLSRYGAVEDWLRPALDAFPPAQLVAWAEALGQPCFTGTSRRIFPKSMKASPLLRAWLRRLAALGVEIRPKTRWTGWTENGQIQLDGPDGPTVFAADATILALGGKSWSRLGSDGSWTRLLAEKGVPLAPFRPANCGFQVAWSAPFLQRFAGTPLKRVALTGGGQTQRGDALITDRGIEGGAIYTLSAGLRDEIAQQGEAWLTLDLRPDIERAEIVSRLGRTRARESLSNRLRKSLRLPPVAVALLRESGEVPTAPTALAERIKALPIRLTAPDAMERAISVAGGVTRAAVTDRLMLRALPGTFVCGEMLDWEAPTGGYLLQGVFATGRWAAQGALDWLEEQGDVA